MNTRLIDEIEISTDVPLHSTSLVSPVINERAYKDARRENSEYSDEARPQPPKSPIPNIATYCNRTSKRPRPCDTEFHTNVEQIINAYVYAFKKIIIVIRIIVILLCNNASTRIIGFSFRFISV